MAIWNSANEAAWEAFKTNGSAALTLLRLELKFPKEIQMSVVATADARTETDA